MALPLGNLSEMVIDDKDYKDLLESIRFVYGYDFTDYAESSVRRRISHFMISHTIKTVDHLAKTILKDESIFEQFVQEMSITVTQMFRDPSFYRYIRKEVVKRLATYPTVRIWIAGCATGEEVYSLTILLHEEGLLDRCVIYATDINQQSLRIAKEGIYSLNDMKTYAANYQNSGGKNVFSRYYIAKFDSALLEKSFVRNVIFSPHNLATDTSFNEFQLILCRNVLLYFNQTLQNKVINLLYNSLCNFGFLGLGDKESLLFSDKKEFFTELGYGEKIYMKTK